MVPSDILIERNHSNWRDLSDGWYD